MSKKSLNKAKFFVHLVYNKAEGFIATLQVYDNRTKEYWPLEEIENRGIRQFMDEDDLKETLNWCMNGDSSKYCLKWELSNPYQAYGKAYIFD